MSFFFATHQFYYLAFVATLWISNLPLFLSCSVATEQLKKDFISSREQNVLSYVLAAQPLLFRKEDRLQADDVTQALTSYLFLIQDHLYEEQLIPANLLARQVGYWIHWQPKGGRAEKVFTHLSSYAFVDQMNYTYAEQLHQLYFNGTQEQREKVDTACENLIRAHFSLPTSMQERKLPIYELLGNKGCYGLLSREEELPAVYRKIILSYLYDPFDIEELLLFTLPKNRRQTRDTSDFRTQQRLGGMIKEGKELPVAPTLLAEEPKEKLVAALKKNIWQNIAYKHWERAFYWGISDLDGVALKVPMQLGYLLFPLLGYLFSFPYQVLIPQSLSFSVKGICFLIYSYILHNTIPYWPHYPAYPIAKFAEIAKGAIIIFLSLLANVFFALLKSPKQLLAVLGKTLLGSTTTLFIESYLTKKIFKYLPIGLGIRRAWVRPVLVLLGLLFLGTESLFWYFLFA